MTLHLEPDIAEELEKRAGGKGQAAESLANEILRRGLKNGAVAESPVEGQNAYERLKEFIGKFDSGKVDASTIPQSDDPYEREFGDILVEKYRKQGLNL